ncbi:MAG TPA: CDP-alcohol phosphatidyltransferase family protein [Actinomycetota bacterium]
MVTGRQDGGEGRPGGGDRIAVGEGEGVRPASLDRIATVPNLLSLIRILAIPVFVLLILHHGTEGGGLILLGAVVATDWIDGYIARHTAAVSNVGKLLDPVADRLALIAALAAMVARDAFPLWAALLVIVRDAVILVAGTILLVRLKARIDVRWIGKAATFGLMVGIPLIAWGNFGLFLHAAARVFGWLVFAVAIVLYYAATVVYAFDFATAARRARRLQG